MGCRMASGIWRVSRTATSESRVIVVFRHCLLLFVFCCTTETRRLFDTEIRTAPSPTRLKVNRIVRDPMPSSVAEDLHWPLSCVVL